MLLIKADSKTKNLFVLTCCVFGLYWSFSLINYQMYRYFPFVLLLVVLFGELVLSFFLGNRLVEKLKVWQLLLIFCLLIFWQNIWQSSSTVLQSIIPDILELTLLQVSIVEFVVSVLLLGAFFLGSRTANFSQGAPRKNSIRKILACLFFCVGILSVLITVFFGSPLSEEGKRFKSFKYDVFKYREAITLFNESPVWRGGQITIRPIYSWKAAALAAQSKLFGANLANAYCSVKFDESNRIWLVSSARQIPVDFEDERYRAQNIFVYSDGRVIAIW